MDATPSALLPTSDSSSPAADAPPSPKSTQSSEQSTPIFTQSFLDALDAMVKDAEAAKPLDVRVGVAVGCGDHGSTIDTPTQRRWVLRNRSAMEIYEFEQRCAQDGRFCFPRR